MDADTGNRFLGGDAEIPARGKPERLTLQGGVLTEDFLNSERGRREHEGGTDSNEKINIKTGPGAEKNKNQWGRVIYL